MTTRVHAIDLIKGVAVLFVVLQHTVDRSVLLAIFSPNLLFFAPLPGITSLPIFAFNGLVNLTIDQAVPLFLVVMGINAEISGRGPRIRRLIYPFILIFIISLAIGISRGQYYIGANSLLFQLPVSGPGNYFIPLAVSFAIIGKWVVTVYRRWPQEMIIGAFLVNLSFNIFIREWEYYDICILRCIFAIVLGMYIYENGINKYILIMLPISIAVIVSLRDWNALTFFFPAFSIAIAIHNSFGNRILEVLGKASYHIFLVQILYFGSGIAMTRSMHSGYVMILYMLVDLIIPLVLGLLFWSSSNFKFKSHNVTLT